MTSIHVCIFITTHTLLLCWGLGQMERAKRAEMWWAHVARELEREQKLPKARGAEAIEVNILDRGTKP